jgi:hypothetical protein
VLSVQRWAALAVLQGWQLMGNRLWVVHMVGGCLQGMDVCMWHGREAPASSARPTSRLGATPVSLGSTSMAYWLCCCAFGVARGRLPVPQTSTGQGVGRYSIWA